MHPIQEKLLKLIDTKNISGLTLRKIGSMVNEPLPQKIKHHLSQLERKGFIVFDNKSGLIKRVSHKVTSSDFFVSIPIVGSVNCGPRAIYANENIEGYLKVSKKIIPKKDRIFALKAQGNSLNKASINGKNIEDGDYIIIDSEYTKPKDGDYIVSVIDDMANVKKYIWDKNNSQIILLSESTQDYPPFFIHKDDNLIFNGKVIEVIKNPNY